MAEQQSTVPRIPVVEADPDPMPGQWVECWSCCGQGTYDDCFEDTCCCLDPPCLTPRCDVCKGKGGWTCEPAEADDGQ